MTTMTIKGQIQEDMKTAMRSQEKDRLATIRLILAAIKQREVDERITLTDDQVLAVLEKMLKQRRDSIAQFTSGNRPDLAEIEQDEIKIIQHYLPAQLTEAEILTQINAALKESGAVSQRDMGKVMGLLKSRLQGRADMGIVSAKLKELLQT